MDAGLSSKRGSARKEAILTAAMDIIRQQGAHQVTMSAIAERARASKETVYRHFSDRTGLFSAVLNRFAEMQLQACPSASDDESLEEGLLRLGHWYLDMAMQPESLSFYRFVVGTTEQIPELGQSFTQQITEPILEQFQVFFQSHVSGWDSSQLAQHYLGLLQGKMWNRALVNPNELPDKGKILEQVERTAQLMAKAVEL